MINSCFLKTVFYFWTFYGFVITCPAGLRQYGDTCYLFGTKTMNYSDALTYCTGQKGYLVMIQSANENAFLKAIVKLAGVKYWIGANDVDHECDFRWSVNYQAVMFTDWGLTNPSNGGGIEGCVHFYSSGGYQWNDASCDRTYRPLCEIWPCVYTPCQNGGTCIRHYMSYTCVCEDDCTGFNCETDMCKPVGADIVFVLDTSYSEGKEIFDKQKDYIKGYVRNLPIGLTDFQISLITFSYLPRVHFYLNTLNSNTSITAAINTIQHEDGPTYLGKALQLVRDKILTSKQGSRYVKTYVIVLTDGLFSDGIEAIANADKLKQDNIDVITVAVGVQILHNNLMKISSTGHVFPMTSNDVLQYILMSSVMPECPDCSRYPSDVAIFLDASSNPHSDSFLCKSKQ